MSSVPFKIGDRVIITGGHIKFRGLSGFIVGIIGSVSPFHWNVKLESLGQIVLMRGNELRMV